MIETGFGINFVEKFEDAELASGMREIFSVTKNDPNAVSVMVDRYFVPQMKERKNNAEVSTPYFLRQNMLDTIPKEFWTKPRRVFEPCAGKGGFLLDIIARFKNGLVDLYPDETERYRCIVEECLYWSDINPVNVYICRLLLSPFGNHNLKYNLGDTLKLNTKEKWEVEEFDAVIGNPPYNDASGNKGKGHTLWTSFVKKALTEWVCENGYITYVHPSLWRQVNHEILNLMKPHQMLYLEIHGIKDGLKTFKCTTRYDWYTLQKVKPFFNTIVVDEIGEKTEIYLPEWQFIPNFMFTEIKSMLANCDDEKCEIIKDRSAYGSDKSHISKTKSLKCIHPCVYSVSCKNEMKTLWSSTRDNGHFGVSKVIYGSGMTTGLVSDRDGDYGLTEWCSGIVCFPDEHRELINFLRSPMFNRIKMALAVSKTEINTKNLRLFRDRFWKNI